MCPMSNEPAYPVMVLCPTCGNKRCPKATDAALACTGSNEQGQPGSRYSGVPKLTPLAAILGPLTAYRDAARDEKVARYPFDRGYLKASEELLALATTALTTLARERDEAVAARDEWSRQCNMASEAQADAVSRLEQASIALAQCIMAATVAPGESMALGGEHAAIVAVREIMAQAAADRAALATVAEALHCGATAEGIAAAAADLVAENKRLEARCEWQGEVAHEAKEHAEGYRAALRGLVDAIRQWVRVDVQAAVSPALKAAEARLAGGAVAASAWPTPPICRECLTEKPSRLPEQHTCPYGGGTDLGGANRSERPAPSAPAPQYEPYAAREACTLEHSADACRVCGETAELIDAADLESLRADRELLRALGVALLAVRDANETAYADALDAFAQLETGEVHERALALAAQGRGKDGGR